MKYKLICLLWVLSISLPTFSQTDKIIGNEAKNLLSTVFNNCPIEFIQAMRGANRVGSVVYKSPRPASSEGPIREVYKITTVAGGYAPSFQSYDVATLTITRTSIVEEFPAFDRGIRWRTDCEVTSP